MLWGENRGKWKGQQSSWVEPRTPLAWTASALPLNHDSHTTTNPHNPLCVLHRWYWMPQSHTWQPLSMCRQNSVRGWPEHFLHQERTHAEWFSKCSEHLALCWKFWCYEAKLGSWQRWNWRSGNKPLWEVVQIFQREFIFCSKLGFGGPYL